MTMMKENKKQLIVSSIIILLPILMGVFLWEQLPEQMTTHWGVHGQADGWTGKAFAIFGLPVILLAVHWVAVGITAADPKNKNQNKKVVGMISWILPVLSLVTNGMMYAAALGNFVSVDIMTRILLGVMFVGIGNYLPKCKQNHTIGFKVTWTLHNEENWNKTHRFTGKLWVAGGLFVLLTMAIPMESIMYVLMVVCLLVCIVPILYSYGYYRKQRKQGTATKEEGIPTAWEKKWTRLCSGISIVIIGAVGVLLVTGEIQVQFEEKAFTIDATYWSDAKISYADIDKAEYREQDEPGSRVSGFGSLKLSMGSFQNEEFGNYTRYSYVKCKSCIVLWKDDKVLVFNGKDEATTKHMYEELERRRNEE